jgi:ketosteroid isomerase-like protein
MGQSGHDGTPATLPKLAAVCRQGQRGKLVNRDWCGGSEVLFSIAANPTKELPNQNYTGMIGFQCPFESEVRKRACGKMRRTSDSGHWTGQIAAVGFSHIKTGEEAMTVTRRELALPAIAVSLFGIVPAFAAGADEEAVAEKVDAFRKAQIAADAKAFEALCADELSYSHSSGRVEDKATFIANATSGKSRFLSIDYKDTTIRVVGPAAIVRFHWLGEQESVPEGKKTSTDLHILMNWQKQGSDWKLLSRAATKL